MLKHLFPFSSCTVVSLSVPSRRHSRRGSIQNHTSRQCYRDLLKGSILQQVGAEEQAKLIQVCTILHTQWYTVCMYSTVYCYVMLACILIRLDCTRECDPRFILKANVFAEGTVHVPLRMQNHYCFMQFDM